MASKNSIQVAIKIRPIQSKEKDVDKVWKVSDNSIYYHPSDPYFFDYIFDQDVQNNTIFDKMAKNIVHSSIHGFNGTIFVYGQTSSGKTYTMMGNEHDQGVQVLAAKEIFKEIESTTDRRFLLRVGYIEIYNEKIYDLLNKKNTDLKIHETSTGIINISNCEEPIITCQEDLLHYLCLGNKERTVGETNMNERSSRSHAIFRIIIESQKMDEAERTKDDVIIQSVLNLVDLAGSERADQSGARGARLKEGGYINKSLMFLSNVIKQLSENENVKFISYRDSKLTRILQASLGGNALTSIICTIKATAVEETQSTLSFAMRAKTIKNKPQVNEIISDATMMKRLERKIKDLETHLAEERSKNESQIKVGQLEQRIKNEVLKIISFNSLQNIRTQKEKRRRTWCPATSSNAPPVAESTPQSLQQHQQLVTPMAPSIPSRLQSMPKHGKYFTPHITCRNPAAEMPQSYFLTQQQTTPQIVEHDEQQEEQFLPGELCNFEIMPSSVSPTDRLRLDNCKTPTKGGGRCKISITPQVATSVQRCYETMQNDFLELQEYTNLENEIRVDHDAFGALKQQLESLSQCNKILENERIAFINSNIELDSTKDSLNKCEKRCDELQIVISELTIANESANSKISKYEEELTELKQTNNKLEVENRGAVSLDFEFQRHKTKTKLRENDLIEALAEKEKEIAKLEKSLNSVTKKKLQISKEDLIQLSRGSNELLIQSDGSVCVKCEDLQRLLDENKKVQLDLEKLTMAHKELELVYQLSTEETAALQAKVEEVKGKNGNEICALNNKLVATRQENENIQIDFEKRTNEHMELESKYERAVNEAASLQAKLTEIKTKEDGDETTIRNLLLEVATLNDKLATNQQKNEEVQRDLIKLTKEHVKLQSKYKQTKEAAAALQLQLTEVTFKHNADKTETTNLRLSIAEITNKVAMIQQDNVEVESGFEKIKQMNEELHLNYTQRTEAAASLEASLREITIERFEGEATIKKLRHELVSLKEELTIIYQEYEKVQFDLKKLTKEHMELQLIYKHTKDATDSLQIFLKQVPVNQNSDEATITKFREKLETAKQENIQQELKYDSLQLVWQKQNESLIEMQAEHEAIQEKYQNLQTEYEKLEQTYAQSLRDCTQLQNAHETLQVEVDELKTSVEQAQKQLPEVDAVTKLNKDNEKLVEELAELQRQYENLQLNYDELSNQLMESLQEYEKLEQTYAQSLKDCTQLQNAHDTLQAEVDKLKTRMEQEGRHLLEGDAVTKLKQDNEKLVEELAELQHQFQNVQRNYDVLSNQLMDSLPEEESLRDQCKHLESKSMLGVWLSKNKSRATKSMDFDSIIGHGGSCSGESMRSSGVYLDEDMVALQPSKVTYAAKEASAELIEQNIEFKRQIEELRVTNEHLREENKSLLESTERNINEMREEISKLSDELLEKSMFIEKCACEDYQTQIECLKKERQEVTIICEELQEKITKECASGNALGNDTLCVDGDEFEQSDDDRKTQEIEYLKSIINDLKAQLELQVTTFKIQCSEFEQRCIAAEASINTMQEEHQQKLSESQTACEILKAQLETETKTHKEEKSRLQLELYTNMESSENDFRQTLQRSNRGWNESKDNYEETIKSLQEQLDSQVVKCDSCDILQTQLANKDKVSHQLEETAKEIQNQLKKDITEMQRKSTETEEELRVLKVQYKDAIENRLQLEEINKGLVSAQELLKKERDTVFSLKEKHDQNEKLMQEEILELKKVQLKFIDANNKLKDLEELNFCLQNGRDAFKIKLEDTEKKFSEANNKLNEWIADNKKISTENEKLSSENKHLSSENEKISIERDALQKERDILVKSKQELDSNQQILESEIEKLSTEHKNLSREYEKMSMERDALQKDRDILVKSKQELDINQKTLESEIEKLLTEHKNFSSENEKISIERDGLQKERDILVKSKQEVDSDQKTFESEISKLKEILKLHENTKSELQNLLESKDKESEDILKKLQNNENKYQEMQEKIHELLNTVEFLSDEKHELENTIVVLNSEYKKALQVLKHEKENLTLVLDQQKNENSAIAEREATLNLKIKALTQQLDEAAEKILIVEQLRGEQEQVQKLLTAANDDKHVLLRQIQSLEKALADNQRSETATWRAQIRELQAESVELERVRKSLVLENERLKTQIYDDQYRLQKNQKEFESWLRELELKCKTLQEDNIQLHEENSSLAEQLQNALRQVSECGTLREELARLTGEHEELQSRLKESVAEADQCRRDLEEDVAQYKETIDRHTKTCDSYRTLLATKEAAFKVGTEKLENTISGLLSEKKALEERLQLTQEIVTEMSRERVKLESGGNTSLDSNVSTSSPRSREIQHLKSMNALSDDRISPMQQKTTLERKNRRLSTHDERRSQSFWGMTRDVASMTDPSDNNCNCAKLDSKLQESERNLFISESQVIALTEELKNHPLKAQNASLLKRLKEEQEMYRIDIKRYKHINSEQKIKLASTADALAKLKRPLDAPPKIVENAETQTHCELTDALHKLQSKYDDIKNICRSRAQIIRDLELELKESVEAGNRPMSSMEAGRLKALQSQCETYKKDLKNLRDKYEKAKILLNSRYEELVRLRARLGITFQPPDGSEVGAE